MCRLFHAAFTLQAAVSDYMQQSNRPYSYINVFDNLRKKIPKGEKITTGRGDLARISRFLLFH